MGFLGKLFGKNDAPSGAGNVVEKQPDPAPVEAPASGNYLDLLEEVMPQDLITPDNISKELVKAILEDAYMNVTVDNDGDLKIKEGITCFVMPNLESKDRIKLLTMFRFKPGASMGEKLQCINNINREYIMICASVSSNGDNLIIDHDIMITGGITKKNLVMAAKRFCEIPVPAISDHGMDIVE